MWGGGGGWAGRDRGDSHAVTARGPARLAGPGGVAYRAVMVRITIGAWVVGACDAGAAGCGDAPEYVEFAELCGEAGPVRGVEFGPGIAWTMRRGGSGTGWS